MISTRIVSLTPQMARELAPRIAAIDPWRRLRISEAALAAMLGRDEPDHIKRAIIVDDAPAGALVIHRDWLLGPYLRHLCVLPSSSGKGVGAEALAWLIDYARREKDRNVWLCVSAFNGGAQRFYRRHGFEVVAILDDLVRAGEAEILMRRRIAPTAV
ncbi:MAG: GNAT family N-acetyltransferase [Alphaproteobacteria bacterium]|nr:GNAT family N-acetyltransferase [Alphaproteobacteria bacterium]